MDINLPSFVLKRFNLENKDELELIKSFDNDELMKKYFYGYRKNFKELLDCTFDSPNIFNTFYAVYYEGRVVGCIEIENQVNTYLDYAIVSSERRKGLATKLLRELSDYLLLLDSVKSVCTVIDKENESSIKVSINSGFNCDSWDERTKFNVYKKVKKRCENGKH